MKKTNILKLIVVSALAIIIAVASSSVSLGATYNYKATNILDNLSKEDNMLIVPIAVNDSSKIRSEIISYSKIVSDFKAKGLTVKSASKTSNIGTGTTITVKENTSTYTILIYGDVTGDGKVNTGDITRLVSHLIGKKTLTGVYAKAANIANNNDKVNTGDLTRLVSYILGKLSTVALKPEIPITAPDTEKPKITSTYSNKTINYGTAYDIMDGIKATDNMDGTITNKVEATIKFESTSVKVFDSKKVGTYTITYNVKDNAGNAAAAVTRTVKVEDPVKSITMGSGYKTQYTYGDALDKTGTIKVTRYSGTTTVQLSKASITGYNKNQLNNQTLTVIYEGKQTTYTVNVKDLVTGITVTAPTKVTYAYNEELDITGATFTKVMKSNTAQTAENIIASMVSGYDKTKPGQQAVTVKYKAADSNNVELTATFNVTVEDSTVVDSIELEEIDEHEIRLGKSVVKALTIKNEAGNDIAVKARYLTYTTTNSKIDVVFLTSEGLPVNDENVDEVVSVMITPAAGAAKDDVDTIEITVDETIATSNAVTTGEIGLTVCAAPVLDSIEEIASITVSLTGEVTELPLLLLNQYGEEIPYSELYASDFGEYGLKVSIRSPLTEAEADKALIIACYDEDGNVVTDNNRFAYIGVSVAMDEHDEPIVSSDPIEDGGVITVAYKDSTNADVDFGIEVVLE